MNRANSLILLILIAACASSPAVQEFLDPQTSVTVNFTDTPIVLYVDRSGHAAYARGYVNVGPIQVNRMGSRRYFIWLGIWNTLGTLAADRQTDGFELVTIYADGEPLLLDLVGWNADPLGVTRPIYTKPISSATDAYYEVTIDQIRLLAAAQEIRLQTSGDHGVSYEMWDSSDSAKRGFREFVAAVSF